MCNSFKKDEMKKSFIKQTASDYGIDYDIVEDIYNTDYENLYYRLEEILSNKDK